jgi:hypothetical protein
MKHAKIAVVTICGVIFLLNSHLFGTVALDDTLGCYGVSSFILSVWPWIDFCVFCIGPFTVMIICNIFIIRQIVLSNKRIESHSGSGMLSPKTAIPSTSIAGNNNGNRGKFVTYCLSILLFSTVQDGQYCTVSIVQIPEFCMRYKIRLKKIKVRNVLGRFPM